MARKLKVEVEAETSKAKRQIEQMVDGVTGGAGDASPAIDKAARALSGAADKTSRSFGKLDETAAGMDRRMLGVTRAFAGMATGLAMSYASRYFAEGSGARKAMDYGGAALSGASAGAQVGSMFGPWGTAIGAIVGGTGGIAKRHMDKTGEMESRLADFEKSERIFAGVKAWQEKLRELTEEMNTGEISAILANLKETEQTFKAKTAEAIKGERYQEAADYQRNLGDVRQRQQQLEALLQKAEEDAKKPGAPELRESMDAVDALARIGGSFAGSDGAMRDLARTGEEQLKVLRNIEAKTGSGGMAWQ